MEIRGPTVLVGPTVLMGPTVLTLSTWGIGILSSWRTGELLIPSRYISKCTIYI